MKWGMCRSLDEHDAYPQGLGRVQLRCYHNNLLSFPDYDDSISPWLWLHSVRARAADTRQCAILEGRRTYNCDCMDSYFAECIAEVERLTDAATETIRQ